MGLFSMFGGIQAKATKVNDLLNLVNLRIGEFIDFAEKHPKMKMDISVSTMLGAITYEIYKLYAPDKIELDRMGMTMKAHKFNGNRSSQASIAYYVAIHFKTILALEEDFNVKIFNDYMQREFAKSVMPMGSDFINRLK